MYRTPAKTVRDVEQDSERTRAGAFVTAGPSAGTNVRRSVEEWDSGKSERQSLTSQDKTYTVGSQKPKPKPTVARRLSVEASGSPPKKVTKPIDRVAEARACLVRLKVNLSNSRNLKAEIKTAVLESADRLFQLVKEAVSHSPAQTNTAKDANSRPRELDGENKNENASASSSPGLSLETMMQKHMDMMKKTIECTRTLNETLSVQTASGGMMMCKPKTSESSWAKCGNCVKPQRRRGGGFLHCRKPSPRTPMCWLDPKA